MDRSLSCCGRVIPSSRPSCDRTYAALFTSVISVCGLGSAMEITDVAAAMDTTLPGVAEEAATCAASAAASSAAASSAAAATCAAAAASAASAATAAFTFAAAATFAAATIIAVSGGCGSDGSDGSNSSDESGGRDGGSGGSGGSGVVPTLGSGCCPVAALGEGTGL